MTLLFDQNVSFKVPKKLQAIFPGAKHLSDLRLEGSKDIEIWEFAKNNNYCIVTFDFDFIDLSTLKGHPPKIILLRIGNSTTDKIVTRLQTDAHVIQEFLENNEEAFLEIKSTI
jgi:predicted nuclease of predicted toxin-antitoxin system